MKLVYIFSFICLVVVCNSCNRIPDDRMVYIPEDALEIDEDIEITIPYNAKEVEELYLKFQKPQSDVNLDSIYPKLEILFHDLELGLVPIGGYHPDHTLNDLTVKPSKLNDFLRYLKTKYDSQNEK